MAAEQSLPYPLAGKIGLAKHKYGRQARTVDEIWSDAWETYGRTSGESIAKPFEMLDLEFTPEGASEPVHVLDSIDRNSVPGLQVGVVLPVEYSAVDPDSARITGATRNYGRQNAVHILIIAYTVAAVVTFAFLPIRRLAGKLSESSQILRPFTHPEAAVTRISGQVSWSQLPENDPRRKLLEALFRARRWPRGET